MLDQFAGVRIERGDLSLALMPAGLDQEESGSIPLGRGWSGVPGKATSSWIGVERNNDHLRLVLQEQSTYVARVAVTGRRDDLRVGLSGAVQGPLGGWGPLAKVFQLSTGNLVGVSELVVLDRDGHHVPGSGVPVRIRVRKLGDPDADFAWMVDDIVRTVRSLALTLASPTSLGIDRKHRGRSYEYEDLIFLRAIARDVEVDVDRILRRPHHRIVSEAMVEDVGRAAELDPGRLAALAADERAIALLPDSRAQARLLSPPAQAAWTRGWRHWAPVRVPAIRRSVSYDTFENRFVRFVLEAMRDRSHAIALAARHAHRPDLAREAVALAVRFAAPLRRSPLDEVGTLRAFTMTSQVLLREDAYNDLLRRYREFLLTSDIRWEGFDLLQESRDVAKLYELWIYLETVRAVAAAATPLPATDDHALLQLDRSGLVVNLVRGVRSEVRFRLDEASVAVTYDRTYEGSRLDPRAGGRAASYSLALRPDVSIEVASRWGPRRLLVDAKYRVDRLSKGFANPNLVDEEDAASTDTGTFKVDDLNKMHAYRDAIGGVHLAVAAYPGAESRLFPFDEASRAERGGVGALGLRPRKELDRRAFRADIRRLLLALAS